MDDSGRVLIPPTLRALSGVVSPAISPANPRRTPTTSIPASTAVRDLLVAPARAGRVVGVHPTCVYVSLAADSDTGPDLVALETADALGLPCPAPSAWGSTGGRSPSRAYALTTPHSSARVTW